MSAEVSAVIKQVVEFVKDNHGKLLYPGLPFIFVPSLLAGLVMIQMGSNPAYYPNDQPAAIGLPLKIGGAATERSPATLLVIPAGSDFFLRSSGRGIKSAWLSMDPAKLMANGERIALKPTGLEVGALRGVRYPMVVVVEGEHATEIDPVGKESQPIPQLELTTPLSNWIVFFLLSGAVFGFGASICFINDNGVIKNPDASV